MAAALVGCSADDESEPSPHIEAQHCADPLELAIPDGSCVRPGIPPDGCAPGFVHDGVYGCEPVLPEEPCPPGLMAVPGETVCRAVMECGQGRWGDIPVDASTQYVDGAYTGGASDGSEAAPWTTIGAAVTAAAPGAIVAVAEGTYVEDVVVQGKAVRLHGVCPDKVAIVPVGMHAICPPTGVCVISGAHGTEVHGVAARGVAISGAEGVVLERIRVHENSFEGIVVETALGATSISLRHSLVEQNRDVGVYIAGTEAHIEASVVRATLPEASTQWLGRGIHVAVSCYDTSRGLVCDPDARASATIVGSLVEQNRDVGLHVAGSDVRLEASVVRTTVEQASDQTGGRGINLQIPCGRTPAGPVCHPDARASATVVGSVIEDNHEVGVAVSGSDLRLETSVVRDTLPQADLRYGRGINVSAVCEPTGACDLTKHGSATLIHSLIEGNHDVGVAVSSSDAQLEATVVRATSPNTSEDGFGVGIGIQGNCGTGPCDPAVRASATISATLVEQSHTVGVMVLHADFILDASIVRATSARRADGLFGDGVLVQISNATITRTRVEDSARAGIANLGTHASLGSTRIQCALFALAGASLDDHPFAFEDVGNNLCGCPMADAACKAVTADLEPPEPLPELDP